MYIRKDRSVVTPLTETVRFAVVLSSYVVFQIGFWPPRDRLWFAPLFFLYSSNEFADKRGDGLRGKGVVRLYFGQIR